MNKKKLIIIIALALVVVAGITVGLIVGLSSNNGDSSSSNPDSSRDIIWTDTQTPDPEDEKDPEVTSPAITYPEKPVTAPETANTDLSVTVGELSVSDECYTLTDEGGVSTVTYSSLYALPAYAYVYAPVENYHGKYSYLKIKADCVGVQKIAIVAVYYEMYDANRPGVTVYNNAVVEGENTIICDLNEANVLDSFYGVAMGEKVTQKQIIGFMIFVDSNPKQLIDDFEGSITFNQIAVVDDSDSDLTMLNSAPIISGWTKESSFDPYTSATITQTDSATTGSKNAKIEYSFSAGYPFIEAQIFNYKSEYTTLKMKIKGENVKNLTVAIKYSLSTVSGAPGYNYLQFGMSVPTAFDTVEFDFSALEELTSDFNTTVPGSYVKNLKPTALYFYIDTATAGGGAGTLYIEDVEFVKVVEDGTPKVTATWLVGGAEAGITKSNVESGGVATLTYNKHQGWNQATVNVSSYSAEYSVLVVKVKFYGAENLGIALVHGGNTVIQNSDGQTTANVTLTDTKESGSDDKGAYVFHTYKIDFSNALATGSSDLLSSKSISAIYFYIDAVSDPFTNERIMQFVGITFEKPQVSE